MFLNQAFLNLINSKVTTALAIFNTLEQTIIETIAANKRIPNKKKQGENTRFF